MKAPDLTHAPNHWPKLLLSVGIGAIFLILPVSVLLVLDRGLDVSDTGHYYVSLYHWADIEMMSTQFPLVWKLLPLPDNILVNRLMVFGLLMGSSVALFLQAGQSTLGQKNLSRDQNWVLILTGAGASTLYYYYWLPDPSYNSIGLILMLIVLGAAFAATRIENLQSWHFRNAAIMAGFAGFGLAVTRPVTAISLIVISAGLFFLLAKPSWRRLSQLLMFSLLGAALFFMLVQVFIEPINITLDRMRGGIQKREVLGIHRLVSLSYTYAREEIDIALGTAPWGLLMAGFGGALAAPGVAERFTKTLWLRMIGAIIGASGLVWIQLLFWEQTGQLSVTPLELISYFYLNLGLVAIFVTMLAGLGTTTPTLRKQYWRLSGICTLLLLTTHSFSVFGTGLWITNAAMAAVFTFLACVLVALHLAKGSGQIWSLAMIAALFLPTWAVRTNIMENPYRLETSLDAQTQPTRINGGRSTIKTDPATKEFFDRLSTIAPRMGSEGKRPILIDLSGRMPMVQYHLNARPAYTAWLLSAYSGSNAFLTTIIERMSEEELARAWILDAPDYEYRLDPAPIIARGLVLERDYEVATTAFAPYIKTDIVILAPRSRNKTNPTAE